MKNVFLKEVFLVDGLKYNLLSISQICGENHRVTFESNTCRVESLKNEAVLFKGYKKGNIYIVNLETIENIDELCLVSMKVDEQFAWHRKLGHVSIGILAKLSSLNLVRGLPKLSYAKEFFCDACAKGKQVRSSFKSKNDVTTSRILELLHLDLFGPSNYMSIGGKYYGFVLVDNFSR